MEKSIGLKFMASTVTKISHGSLGILFFATAILHYLTGNWLAIPDLILAGINIFVVARLLTSPVLEIHEDNITFLRNAVIPAKVVFVKDIIDIEKRKKNSLTIVLKNRKTITLPIRWIKKSELESLNVALRKIEDTALANAEV